MNTAQSTYKEYEAIKTQLGATVKPIRISPKTFGVLSKIMVFPIGTGIIVFYLINMWTLLEKGGNAQAVLILIGFGLLAYLFFPFGQSHFKTFFTHQFWAFIYHHWNGHENDQDKDIVFWPLFGAAMEVGLIRHAFLNWIKQGPIGQHEIQLAEKSYHRYLKMIKQCQTLIQNKTLSLDEQVYLDQILKEHEENKRNHSDLLPHILWTNLQKEAQSQHAKDILSKDTTGVSLLRSINRL